MSVVSLKVASSDDRQQTARDLEMADLRDQISSLRQNLCDCEVEKTKLLSEKSVLVAQVELLTAELERFKVNERTLTSSHVRISSDPDLHPSDRVVDAVYHSSSSRSVSDVAWRVPFLFWWTHLTLPPPRTNCAN
jgi:hypothetical protein